MRLKLYGFTVSISVNLNERCKDTKDLNCHGTERSVLQWKAVRKF